MKITKLHDQAVEADWQEPVLSITTAYEDSTATVGYRYIAPATSGDWTKDNIYQYNGTSWNETQVTDTLAVWVDDENALYVYNGAVWVKLGSIVDHSSLLGCLMSVIQETSLTME